MNEFMSNIRHPQGVFIAYWPKDITPIQVIQVYEQFLGTFLPSEINNWNVPIFEPLTRLTWNEQPKELPVSRYITFRRI